MVSIYLRPMSTERRHRGRLTLAGFLLFFLGFLSIVLGMIGVQFMFMAWMDHWGRGPGFLIRLMMILAGFILIILDQSDPEE
jgi:uncharacterized membrane protein